jgi:hypothetical protein
MHRIDLHLVNLVNPVNPVNPVNLVNPVKKPSELYCEFVLRIAYLKLKSSSVFLSSLFTTSVINLTALS